MTTKKRLMTALPLAALAAAAMATLGACTTTTSSCSNGTCTVNLSGAGAETEINNDTIEVSLEGASGGTATFAVDGESATCSQGDTLEVAGHSVTCTEVGDDKLSLQIS